MSSVSIEQDLIEKAIEALKERTFYSHFPEHPKAYSEDGLQKANEWFSNQLNSSFNELNQDNSTQLLSSEISPYTQKSLGITYPSINIEKLIENASKVTESWRYATPETRVSVLTTSLEYIKTRFFDIALATMHTTGQSFMMSFQASGPHACDRAMEAIALGYKELKNYPIETEWEKPMGKFNIKVKKNWRAIGKGTSLVIGCSTFPIWNTVPGLYASLITGNPVIVKPHPGAILPIAIVVAELQKALKEKGFDELMVQFATDTIDNPITKQLAEHSEIKLIDYTGNSNFGDYIESLSGKNTFTEKAGINSVIIDSCEDIDTLMNNLAFSACLYSGQMCTAPQNIFIPAGGINSVNQGHLSFDDVANKFIEAINSIVMNPKMSSGTLGAIQNQNTIERVKSSAQLGGKILLENQSPINEEFPNARTASPVVIEVDASQKSVYGQELFGPIVLLVKTSGTEESTQLARELASTKGAISCGAYTTNEETKKYITRQMDSAFTPVAFNFTGFIWMNQNAAFSDFHVTGGNPAGNATFTDEAYLVRRFVWVGTKEVIN